MNSLVSIIIPYFNRCDFVKVMVESVISQSYKNWELLMVDDGSTDGTHEYVDSIAATDSRVISLSREPDKKGAPACRNMGLKYSKGEYVVFLDSDDYIDENCIFQRVKFMESRKDLDFGVFPGLMYSGKELKDGNHFFGVQVLGNDEFDFVMRDLPFTVVNTIIRQDSLITKGRIWDEQLLSLQDADFNIQNIFEGLKYDYASGSVIDYYARIIGNTGSVSKKAKTPKHMQSHLYYAQKLHESLERRDNKHRLAFMFCIQGLFMIVQADSYYGTEMVKLVNQSSAYGIFMRIKASLYRLLIKCHLSYRITNWLVFPTYMAIYKIASVKRRILYKDYKPSTDVLEKLHSILLS